MSAHDPSVRRQPGRLPLTLALATLTGLMAGCVEAPRATVESPHPSPAAATPPPAPERQAARAAEPDAGIPDGAELTVDAVVRRAVARNPNREVFAATNAAAQAEVLIARAWANPELELSGGQAKAREGGATETIYGVDLRQRFELPGKRSSRIEAARAGQVVTEREVTIDALALEVAVRDACAALAVAEAQLVQAHAAFAAAEQMNQVTERRAAAKEAEPGEGARATLELVTARAARDRAQRQAEASRAAVRVWAGGGLPERFTIADALPSALPQIDRQAALAAAETGNPRMALLRAQADASTSALARERRAAQPDITVGAFSDREADADNLGMSVGIDLPLWNRNQGGVALADAQRRAALARVHAEQQLIAREVDLAWQMYDSRRQALGPLLAETQTAAKAALDAKLSAFAAGEATLLDVLDARRAALAVDEAVLDARSAAAEASLTLGRALGSFTFITTPAAGAQP